MKTLLRVAVPALLAVALVSGCATTSSTALQYSRVQETALDRYVYTPDPNYSYHVVKTVEGKGYKVYVVDMTSQKWLTEAEVDRPYWQHFLTIIRPDTITHDTALMFIGGGSNDGKVPSGASDEMIQMAVTSESVVAELKHVPNEPLVFADDPNNERSEDAIIAYTWDKFLRTGDEKWPARLPMTKSAKAAMDTIQDLFSDEAMADFGLEHFVVAGGSKRGWTTWTIGAVDNRVVAIAPIVIDMLNVIPSFQHHYEVYGDWAPAVGDYVAMGTFQWMGSPEERALYDIVEPYSYRERMTMPKLIMNASGDQFFLPDSSQFYWRDLLGEKSLRYVPNASHSLSGSDAYETLFSFYYMVLNNIPRPEYDWTVAEDGTITVKTQAKPAAVKLWQATNPDARDFRVDTIGKAYTSTDLTDMGGGTYVGKVETPAKGYTAYFVELTFTGLSPTPFKVTTQIKVAPDTVEHTYVAPTWPEGGFIRGKK